MSLVMTKILLLDIPLDNITNFIYEKIGIESPVDILILQSMLGSKRVHAGTD